MRQSIGGRMKRLRLDGANLRRRSRNANGQQPGTPRIEIERQGTELLGQRQEFRGSDCAGPSAGVSAGSAVRTLTSEPTQVVLTLEVAGCYPCPQAINDRFCQIVK